MTHRDHNHKDKLTIHDLRRSSDAASSTGRIHQPGRHRDEISGRMVKLTDRERLRMNDLYERSGW